MRQNCYFHFGKISNLAVRSPQDPAPSITGCVWNRYMHSQTYIVPNIVSRNYLNSESYQKSWILCHSCNKYVFPFCRSHIHERLTISQHALQLQSVLSLPHLESLIHLWAFSTGRTWTYWSRSNKMRATKMLRGLEHLFSEDRLREMVLLSLGKTRLRVALAQHFNM